MKESQLLSELQTLHASHKVITGDEERRKWLAKAAALVEQVNGSDADEIRRRAQVLAMPLSTYMTGPAWIQSLQIVENAIAKLESGGHGSGARGSPATEQGGMSRDLRNQILLLLEEHAETGSPYFKQDKEIAERLGRSVGEIQRQMDILESQGLITPANSRDGNSARINPRGLLRVEEIREPRGMGISHTKNTQSASDHIPAEIEESLTRFRRDYPDSNKVAFLMMRFGKTTAHENIVAGIRKALDPQGITVLRADDKQYHDDLFPNVLTYVYGCRFGIAVFERIETEQFNPNVALEVGYMFALRKDVCLLKDRALPTLQADLVGKLYREFDPLDPFDTIPNELSRWLKDKGIGRSAQPGAQADG